MEPTDLAIPMLPSRSVSATVAFYASLGFEGGANEFDNNYAILRRGTVELHFFTHKELVPAEGRLKSEVQHPPTAKVLHGNSIHTTD